ncbi:hypothetical protein [Streptosporangium sp. NPDC000396]|uniref:hypothetical protein n=1 Tax=Streptosporangium sp. NPDC000396 TaxID=3366185 RepID=UPI0036A7E8F7
MHDRIVLAGYSEVIVAGHGKITLVGHDGIIMAGYGRPAGNRLRSGRIPRLGTALASRFPGLTRRAGGHQEIRSPPVPPAPGLAYRVGGSRRSRPIPTALVFLTPRFSRLTRRAGGHQKIRPVRRPPPGAPLRRGVLAPALGGPPARGQVIGVRRAGRRVGGGSARGGGRGRRIRGRGI